MILNRMRIVRPVLVMAALSLVLGSDAARATTVTPPDFAQLVKESDCVVQARVKSITAVNKALPGKRPMICSRVELEVKEIITGSPPSPLILEVLGGKLGDQEMYISGAPQFAVGEEAIFFVQGNGTQIYPLARMMHGLYPIRKDPTTGREYMVRSNGQPMTSVTDVRQPMHSARLTTTQQRQLAASALSPADFITQIRSKAKALKTGERKPRAD